MAKFVKHRFHFVISQKRRFSICGFWIVANIEDYRLFVVKFGLGNKIVHPRTTSFAGAGKIIRIEKSKLFAIFFEQFINLYIFVICGDIGSWLKGYSVQ